MYSPFIETKKFSEIFFHSATDQTCMLTVKTWYDLSGLTTRKITCELKYKNQTFPKSLEFRNKCD